MNDKKDIPCNTSVPKCRTHDWTAIILLFMLPFIVYFPVATGQATFAGFDHTGINQPLKEYAYDNLRSGDLPLWENRLDRGLPVFAEGEVGIFYPLNVLFLLPGDFLTIYNIVMLLVLSTAGLLFYWWIRRFGIGPLASFIAAMAHQWGATVNFNKANLNILEGFIMAPLLMLLLEPLVENDKPWQRCAGIAAVFAIIVFAGQAQYVIYTGLFACTYIVLRIIISGKSGWKSVLVSMGIPFVIGAVLGAGLAAVQLLSTMELIPLSERGPQAISDTFSVRGLWLSPSRLFATYIFPAYHYSLDHFLPYLSTTIYVGPLAILLAGYAIRFRSQLPSHALKIVFPLLTAGLIFLWLGMGANAPLAGEITSMGILGMLRGHGRFGGYFATVILLLMGMGLHVILRAPCPAIDSTVKRIRGLPLFTIELALMALLAIPFITGRAEYLETRTSLVLMIAMLIIFFAGMLICRLTRSRTSLAVVVIITLIIQTVGFRLTSSETLLKNSSWDADRADLIYISENSESLPEGSLFAIRTQASVRLHERILRSGMAAFESGPLDHIDHLGSANAGLMEGLTICNSDLPLELARWEWLVHRYIWEKVDFTAGPLEDVDLVLLWILGVNWIVTENADLELVGFEKLNDPAWMNRDIPYYIYRRESPVRPYTVYWQWTGVPSGTSDVETRDAFFEYLETSQVGSEVFIEGIDLIDPVSEEIFSESGTSRSGAMGEWVSATEYRANVSTSRDAIFMLRDAWYPGWEVTVNGEPAELIRADLVYKAVKVPPGRNEVVFTYHPTYLNMGWGLSALSLVIILLLGFGTQFIKRKKVSDP